MNDEQARVVFHAAPESLFAVIEHLQMPHTHNCMPVRDTILAVTASWFISVCMDFVYVVSEAESLMFGVFYG
jgi:hypothetical protein